MERVIVTAADHNLKDFAKRAVNSAAALGYPVHVYDLGGLGFGTPLDTPVSDIRVADGFLPCLFKIAAIERSLLLSKYAVWMDADSVLVRNIDEVFTPDYELGVVERVPNEASVLGGHPRAGVINTGTLFFRSAPVTVRFLRQWHSEALGLQSEQGAINKLVQQPLEVRVKRFPGEIYNNYYFDGRFGASTANAKILHYKMEVRHFFKE